MSFSLPFVRRGSKPGSSRKPDNFVHSVLSYTKLEIPTVEVFETAVTLPPGTNPLLAHAELASVFGRRAGEGHFLFRADSTIDGRYWVQSAKPWARRPERAVSALEPKRTLIQVAPGLMYRFTLAVCAGRARLEGTEKEVEPFRTKDEVDAWFKGSAEHFGLRLLMTDVSMSALRFEHQGSRIRIDHAVIEGALEVLNPDPFRARILRGFGHHRRAGLGMIQLTH
ncbi:MAG: type I-E CRISPR-associated protein Cas6/Cse3/CasE [Gemmatimonadota bacterium]